MPTRPIPGGRERVFSERTGGRVAPSGPLEREDLALHIELVALGVLGLLGYPRLNLEPYVHPTDGEFRLVDLGDHEKHEPPRHDDEG